MSSIIDGFQEKLARFGGIPDPRAVLRLRRIQRANPWAFKKITTNSEALAARRAGKQSAKIRQRYKNEVSSPLYPIKKGVGIGLLGLTGAGLAADKLTQAPDERYVPTGPQQ